MRFTAATFVLATAVLPHASAWTVWVNWKSQCGGASYRVDGTGSSPCQLTNIPADQKKPISLTFTNGRGCVGYIYSDRNCGAQVCNYLLSTIKDFCPKVIRNPAKLQY